MIRQDDWYSAATTMLSILFFIPFYFSSSSDFFTLLLLLLLLFSIQFSYTTLNNSLVFTPFFTVYVYIHYSLKYIAPYCTTLQRNLKHLVVYFRYMLANSLKIYQISEVYQQTYILFKWSFIGNKWIGIEHFYTFFTVEYLVTGKTTTADYIMSIVVRYIVIDAGCLTYKL